MTSHRFGSTYTKDILLPSTVKASWPLGLQACKVLHLLIFGTGWWERPCVSLLGKYGPPGKLCCLPQGTLWGNGTCTGGHCTGGKPRVNLFLPEVPSEALGTYAQWQNCVTSRKALLGPHEDAWWVPWYSEKAFAWSEKVVRSSPLGSGLSSKPRSLDLKFKDSVLMPIIHWW
jgi:hypothetical protein